MVAPSLRAHHVAMRSPRDRHRRIAMNPLPARPAGPSAAQHAGRSGRWTATVVAAVAFAFMASVVIDASEPTDRSSLHPAAAATTAFEAIAPAFEHADSPEVTRAVREWVWETPGAARKPAAAQDLEELWLAR
jgi:hypothetical protein